MLSNWPKDVKTMERDLDWYRTIRGTHHNGQLDDWNELLSVTTEKVLDDWKCEGEDKQGTGPVIKATSTADGEWELSGTPPFTATWTAGDGAVPFRFIARWDNDEKYIATEADARVIIPWVVSGRSTWKIRVSNAAGFEVFSGEERLATLNSSFARQMTEVSFNQINVTVEDDRFKSGWGLNPTSGEACKTSCDLTELFEINRETKEAKLKDVRPTVPNTEGQAKRMDPEPGWYRLKKCVDTKHSNNYDPRRDLKEKFGGLGEGVEDSLKQRFLSDFTDPSKALRARMTFFFMNFYAVPFSNVNNWILMWRMYSTIWNGALGNYRELSRKMFADGALRKSLDQLENPPCNLAPIENFGREWFERFTVGVGNHNEGDVKIISRALMNCANSTETFNEDLRTPGIIFDNIHEKVFTTTEEEQRMVVDRILDKKHPDAVWDDEPPMAAQYLCAKLYQEFAFLPEVVSSSASAAGFSPEVVKCADLLYDHNYDVTFALRFVLEDKVSCVRGT